MYLIRDLFHCKPGKAKELVQKFRQSTNAMEKENFRNVRILTDVVSEYWTVVLEVETESLAEFEKRSGFTSRPEVKEIMSGYMDLVSSGRREIYRIEYPSK